MKTTQEILDEHGYEKGVCVGHGEYWDLPNRLTEECIKRIQLDAYKQGMLDAALEMDNYSRRLEGLSDKIKMDVMKMKELPLI